MKEQFRAYLINKGYALVTPSGNPSTVYDYQKRIDKVCEWECRTWNELAANIGTIVALYDVGGLKEDFGKKSNNAFINALKRFKEFIVFEKIMY